MIELFNGSTTPMTTKFFSTKIVDVPVSRKPTTGDEGDFCACRFQCIPKLPFFTDGIGVDEFKNDWFTIYQNSITGGSHTAHIIINGEEIAVTDNTYGTIYNGVVFFGYKFSAFKIWQIHGACTVSAVLRNYSSGNVLVGEVYQNEFNLTKYSDRSAHGTVRIRTEKNGKLRHGNDYSNLQLVPSGSPYKEILPNWPQMVRLPGSLKLSGMPIETDRLMLNDKKQSSLQVMDTGSFEYDLTINLVSSDQILPVLLDDLFANVVFVSDYNLLNFEKYRDVRLIRQSVELTPSKKTRRKNFTFKMIREQSDIEKFND